MKQSNYIKKPREFTKDIPEEIKIKIVDDFRHAKDNTTTGLAKKYGISFYRIDTIINEHLNSLKR